MPGTWSPIPTPSNNNILKRREAIGFSLKDSSNKDIIYIGFGTIFNSVNSPLPLQLGDIWSFNPAASPTWQMAWPGDPNGSPFTPKRRRGAIAFTLKNKAYVGLGAFDAIDSNNRGDKGKHNDFWEFDPLKLPNNPWTQLKTPTGPLKLPAGGDAARFQAVGFSANGKGYVGTGFGAASGATPLNDFFEFDPGIPPHRPPGTPPSFISLQSLPVGVNLASGFGLSFPADMGSGTVEFVVGGVSNGSSTNSIYALIRDASNPLTKKGKWFKAIADIPLNLGVSGISSVTIDSNTGKAYIGPSDANNFYEFNFNDPIHSCITLTNPSPPLLPFNQRSGAVGFAVGTTSICFGTGAVGDDYKNDLWKFTP